MTLKAYMDELRTIAEQQAQELANASNRAHPLTEQPYKPLTEQIQDLMNTLPPIRKASPWLMEELVPRLVGKYRTYPHAKDVGAALRRLGWTQKRDWSHNGGGRRFWYASKY